MVDCSASGARSASPLRTISRIPRYARCLRDISRKTPVRPCGAPNGVADVTLPHGEPVGPPGECSAMRDDRPVRAGHPRRLQRRRRNRRRRGRAGRGDHRDRGVAGRPAGARARRERRGAVAGDLRGSRGRRLDRRRGASGGRCGHCRLGDGSFRGRRRRRLRPRSRGRAGARRRCAAARRPAARPRPVDRTRRRSLPRRRRRRADHTADHR